MQRSNLTSNTSLISQNLSVSFHPLNHPRANQSSITNSKSRMRHPQTSSIKISQLNPENSLTYKQLSETRKYEKSRADFNTSLLIGSRLLGKILSNAFVGVGYHVLNHFFFVFYAFIYLLLLVYLCFCVPNRSGIGHTKKERLNQIKEDKIQSRAELFTLYERTGDSRLASRITFSQTEIPDEDQINHDYTQIQGFTNIFYFYK